MDDKARNQRQEAERRKRAPALIDEIYALLDGVEQDRLALGDVREWRGEKINVYQFQNLYDAIELLEEFGYAHRLGLSATDLGKFLATSGYVDSEVFPRLMSRCISLLKELEGEVAADLPPPVKDGGEAPTRLGEEQDDFPPRPVAVAVEIKVEGWVVTHQRKNAELIADLADLLGQILPLARNVNLPPERQALSQLERAQLISLLETALTLLHAPLVEKGLLKTLGEAAKRGASNATTKGTELALGYALGKLAEVLVKYIGTL